MEPKSIRILSNYDTNFSQKLRGKWKELVLPARLLDLFKGGLCVRVAGACFMRTNMGQPKWENRTLADCGTFHPFETSLMPIDADSHGEPEFQGTGAASRQIWVERIVLLCWLVTAIWVTLVSLLRPLK